MAYKPKTCPACGTVHTKRGEFCSRSCGNKRAHTAESKANISKAKKEWHATSETAAVVAHTFTSAGKNKDPEPVPPQTYSGPDVGQFIADGDLWTEV